MEGKRLTLRFLTPEGPVFEGEVDAVFLPGTFSAFEVLPGHASMVTSLDKGRVAWRTGDSLQEQGIIIGSALVEQDTVTVCAQPES